MTADDAYWIPETHEMVRDEDIEETLDIFASGNGVLERLEPEKLAWLREALLRRQSLSAEQYQADGTQSEEVLEQIHEVDEEITFLNPEILKVLHYLCRIRAIIPTVLQLRKNLLNDPHAENSHEHMLLDMKFQCALAEVEASISGLTDLEVMPRLMNEAGIRQQLSFGGGGSAVGAAPSTTSTGLHSRFGGSHRSQRLQAVGEKPEESAPALDPKGAVEGVTEALDAMEALEPESPSESVDPEQTVAVRPSGFSESIPHIDNIATEEPLPEFGAAGVSADGAEPGLDDFDVVEEIEDAGTAAIGGEESVALDNSSGTESAASESAGRVTVSSAVEVAEGVVMPVPLFEEPGSDTTAPEATHEIPVCSPEETELNDVEKEDFMSASPLKVYAPLLDEGKPITFPDVESAALVRHVLGFDASLNAESIVVMGGADGGFALACEQGGPAMEGERLLKLQTVVKTIMLLAHDGVLDGEAIKRLLFPGA